MNKHARAQVAKRGDKDLFGNKGYRKHLQVEKGEHFSLDEAKINEEARYGGKRVLPTNLADESPIIALALMPLENSQGRDSR